MCKKECIEKVRKKKVSKIIARLVDALLCCVILFVVAKLVCNKKIPSIIIIYFFSVTERNAWKSKKYVLN